jgi:hypothetical protein
MKPSNEWIAIQPPKCDLCKKVAVWRHPLGGLRCKSCPRPAATKKAT